MPVLGIPVVGVLWSLAAVLINSGQVSDLGLGWVSAVLLVLPGGMVQTAAVWVGFGAILWAMIRGFGGRLPLLGVLRLMSEAAWPLWIAAPAVAFWVSGPPQLVAVAAVGAIAGLLGFFMSMAKAVMNEAQWSMLQALCVVSFAAVFISSFLYLNV